jgi:hypothetical protein
LWCKLSKHYFKTNRDIYLAVVYLPPENSTYAKSNGQDIIDKLESDIRHYSQLGSILIMGDLNVCTSMEPDYIKDDTDKFTIPTSVINYTPDVQISDRLNQDAVINERGKEIPDLCVSASLRILNARKPGDSMGSFTCHKYNGSSTVDYVLTSECLYESALYFHVHNLCTLSDHCQISFCLNNLSSVGNSSDVLELGTLPDKFKWDSTSSYKFQQALCSPDIQKELSCAEHDLNEGLGSTDAMVKRLNVIITKAASKCLTMKRVKKWLKPKQKWFNNELSKLRKEVNSMGRLLCHYPRDPQIRGNYFRTLKIYIERNASKSIENSNLYLLIN